MDQRDALAETRCGQCRRTARDTASNDHNVIRATIDRCIRQTAQLLAPCPTRIIDRVRRRLAVFAEKDRVAAPVEAGEIVQCEPYGALWQRHLARRLPRPVLTVRAELGCQCRAVDRQRKPPRMMRWYPILGPHPHIVFAGIGNGDQCCCIGYGTSQAVCEQIGRPHLRLELRVEHPSAIVLEIFRLDQNTRWRIACAVHYSNSARKSVCDGSGARAHHQAFDARAFCP